MTHPIAANVNIHTSVLTTCHLRVRGLNRVGWIVRSV